MQYFKKYTHWLFQRTVLEYFCIQHTVLESRNTIQLEFYCSVLQINKKCLVLTNFTLSSLRPVSMKSSYHSTLSVSPLVSARCIASLMSALLYRRWTDSSRWYGSKFGANVCFFHLSLLMYTPRVQEAWMYCWCKFNFVFNFNWQ